jgi:hypothetical protein
MPGSREAYGLRVSLAPLSGRREIQRQGAKPPRRGGKRKHLLGRGMNGRGMKPGAPNSIRLSPFPCRSFPCLDLAGQDESGGEHARTPNASRGSRTPGRRPRPARDGYRSWTARVFSTAFWQARNSTQRRNSDKSRAGDAKTRGKRKHLLVKE